MHDTQEQVRGDDCGDDDEKQAHERERIRGEARDTVDRPAGLTERRLSPGLTARRSDAATRNARRDEARTAGGRGTGLIAESSTSTQGAGFYVCGVIFSRTVNATR